MNVLADSVERCLFFQLHPEEIEEEVINAFNLSTGGIPISSILACSHVFCEECCEEHCDLYTPCHVGEWVRTNPELYDSEVLWFKTFIAIYTQYLSIDVIPYSFEEINTYTWISSLTKDEKMRQLYTIISQE